MDLNLMLLNAFTRGVVTIWLTSFRRVNRDRAEKVASCVEPHANRDTDAFAATWCACHQKF